MQVHFVLQKELLQAGIPELDTLFPFLSTLAYADTDSEYFGRSSNLNSLAEIQYQNEYDQRLQAHCQGKDGMYKVISVHDNKKEDRVWDWKC